MINRSPSRRDFRSTSFVLAFAFVLAPSLVCAQRAELDQISQQATQLEAELGKFNDNTPDAADVMVRLIDLYHSDARVFGLVRIGNRFVSTHVRDPRHKDVMLKMIDGLEAMSRNKDIIVACRQFLARYPKAPECGDVEIRLANTLSGGKDKEAAADAFAAIWRRHKNTPVGRQAAIRAIDRYTSMRGHEQIAAGGKIADELMSVSKGAFARNVGLRSVDAWARVNKWAESNRAALKLLQMKVISDPERIRELHSRMAENYARLKQHANAAKSYAQARKIRDDQTAHLKLIEQLEYGQAKSREIADVAKLYAKNYPESDDRFRGLTALAKAYLREDNPGAASSLLGKVLAFDARNGDAARLFVEQSGSEPEQYAAAEKALLGALKVNEKDATYLRYTLAFNLYRDRMKDTAKTRQTLRDLVEKSPSDDGYSSAAVDWLLNSAESDEQFVADLKVIAKSSRAHPELPRFANALSNWRQSARRDPKRKTRSKLVDQELESTKRDPVLALSSKQSFRQSKQEAQVREKLLAKGIVEKLSDDYVNRLLDSQGYYYRHYVGSNQRKVSATYYGQLAKRKPNDFVAAQRWLESASDYSAPEVAKEAALHLMRLKDPVSTPDVWRRLMIAADKNKDAKLAKSAMAWIEAAKNSHGDKPEYASFFGDVLHRLDLKDEAVAIWKRYQSFDPQHSEARECAARIYRELPEENQISYLSELYKNDSPFQGRYATWLGSALIKAEKLDEFSRTLASSRERFLQRPLKPWDLDIWQVHSWVDQYRRSTEASDSDKEKAFNAVAKMDCGVPSSAARLALLEMQQQPRVSKMEQVLLRQRSTVLVDDRWNSWDGLFPFAQSAVAKQDYIGAATIASGLLANNPSIDDRRKKAARDIVTQCYARLGSVGLTIDDDSPIAPLLQAALYLRLGDEKLAMATYDENRKLFDEHRNTLPVDLISLVCEQRMAAGGDSNHEYVEDVLRGWMVANSESKQIGEDDKAEMQLLLARNYYKSRRFDVARSEFTTTINRYPNSKQATEARFGIGESFMAQKVFDQAELIFEELARDPEMDIVVRAEFLRGVLAFRRGDRDDARDIFRSVLERVPDVGLANQALFSLSEVYGSEERYIDQLNLLRTVGRLGRRSKRLHSPGMPLSIVVHDSDLGISRGHNKIPVIITSSPGGDSEKIMLISTGAGRGLFRTDVTTKLGAAAPGDGVLQLLGNDTIQCDYPDEFKSEFKKVPLSDVEIKIASSAVFEAASGKIEDKEQESFSERIAREAREEEESEGDLRVSQQRPENQIKPGNDIYLRVIDPDRDLSNDRDVIPIKLTADSGDSVQVMIQESGPHTGIFEGSAATSELPAGALASDTALDHSPLMAIDLDPKSSWLAEPDGATPKTLTVDMKDLREVARLRMTTPDPNMNAPVRADLLGSNDGEFWFRIASHPRRETAKPAAKEFGRMTERVYAGAYYGYTTWNQVADLGINRNPVDSGEVDELSRRLEKDDEGSKKPFAVLWSGKLVQDRPGAARIAVSGYTTGLSLNGSLELPLKRGRQTVDVWLDAGTHDLTIFAATNAGTNGVEATIARSNLTSKRVALVPFTAADFDFSNVKESVEPKAAVLPPVVLNIAEAKLNVKSDSFGSRQKEKTPLLSHWSDKGDTATWDVNVPKAGAYEVWMDCGHPGDGSRFVIETDGNRVPAEVPDTRSFTKFQFARVATVLFETDGARELKVSPTDITGGGLMDLRKLELRHVSGAAVMVAGNHWDFRFPSTELRYTKIVINEYLGESVAINNVVVGGESADETYIPTKEDVLSLANNEVLEIAAGDTVTATYTDEFTQNDTGSSQLLSAKMTATYFNADVEPIVYEFTRGTSGQVFEQRLDLMRVDPGERLVVEIRDYDEDSSAKQDEIEFEVFVNDQEPIKLTATETEEFSGVFTKEVDTSDKKEDGKLTIKAGDKIYIRYLDKQNTFPGHSVPRESVVYVTSPSEGKIRVLATRARQTANNQIRRPRIDVVETAEGEETLVALNAPLTIEVIDPDRAKNAGSTVKVALLSSNGSAVIVECEISNAFANRRQRIDDQKALQQGRFIGQVILQLGGKDSQQLIPKSSSMPISLIGTVHSIDKSDDEIIDNNMIARVLNLTGKDTLTAAYSDSARPDGKTEKLLAHGRLIANGAMMICDREFKEPIESLHVGEKIYFSLSDPDQDVSDERDSVPVQVTTEFGEQETVTLTESMSHSGLFTGSFMLVANEVPQKNNLDESDPEIECYFGDKITAKYIDPSSESEETLEVVQEIPVVIGTDGLVSAFTKTFNDETLAVETKFRIAESYFELFKSHKELERNDEQKIDLEAGRRVLREVMEDYPDPKYAPRVAYLLGQFAQELEQWNEAIRSYEMIIQRYPDHTLAADARYKLAQSYEEAGDFDEALEAYVTLAATHPNSPLIASVMIRISDYFYKRELFDVAAQVGEKFGERFEGHDHAAEMAFRVGQCYYKQEDFKKAGTSFDSFTKVFPDDELASDSLFWSGEAYRLGRNNREAFRRYNRCRWDYPESEAAKYARGRLALPEMLQQFEAEANSVDDE